ACLRQEAQIIELRRAERLIAFRLLLEDESLLSALRALRSEARVAVPPVLPRPRHANRVDARVAEHARERADRGLIEVGFVLIGLQRLTRADGVPLRRPLAQPPDRPRVVRVDLMIEADQRVPIGAIF